MKPCRYVGDMKLLRGPYDGQGIEIQKVRVAVSYRTEKACITCIQARLRQSEQRSSVRRREDTTNGGIQVSGRSVDRSKRKIKDTGDAENKSSGILYNGPGNQFTG